MAILGTILLGDGGGGGGGELTIKMAEIMAFSNYKEKPCASLSSRLSYIKKIPSLYSLFTLSLFSML